MTALLMVANVNPYWLCRARITITDMMSGTITTIPHVLKSLLSLNRISGITMKQTRYQDLASVYFMEITGASEITEVKMNDQDNKDRMENKTEIQLAVIDEQVYGQQKA